MLDRTRRWLAHQHFVPVPAATAQSEDPISRWAGTGAIKWQTRVEIFVDDDSANLVGPTFDALSILITNGEPAAEAGCGCDQGTGLASPVIGMVFSVAADSPAAATQTAVAIAQQAMGDQGRGLYGVSVVRSDAAPLMRPDDFPPLND